MKKEQVVKTLDDAINKLFPRFAGIEETDAFKGGKSMFGAYCHSQLSGGIGMQIRNEFKLWHDDSPLHVHMKEIHNCEHPDDMSAMIIDGIYDRIASGDIPKLDDFMPPKQADEELMFLLDDEHIMEAELISHMLVGDNTTSGVLLVVGTNRQQFEIAFTIEDLEKMLEAAKNNA